MIYAGAAKHPVACPDPICSKRKRNLCNGLGTAEEGARSSTRQSEALPAAASPGQPRLPCLLGNNTRPRLPFLLSQTCLHRRALFKHLSGSRLGRGQYCPGTKQDLDLCARLLWCCPTREPFLAQVKMETLYHSPWQTKQFEQRPISLKLCSGLCACAACSGESLAQEAIQSVGTRAPWAATHHGAQYGEQGSWCLGTGVPGKGLTSQNALPPAQPHQTKAGGACVQGQPVNPASISSLTPIL